MFDIDLNFSKACNHKVGLLNTDQIIEDNIYEMTSPSAFLIETSPLRPTSQLKTGFDTNFFENKGAHINNFDIKNTT